MVRAKGMTTLGQPRALGQRFEESGREGVDFSDLFPAAPHGSVSGLPADDLRQLVLESSSGQAIKDIRIKKAIFSGNVHLEHVSFGGYLRFEDCRFKGKIDLRHARLRRLKFVNCVFEGVVEADVAVIEGDVDFEGCDALKGIAFPSAAVEGRFVFSDTTIRTIADTTGAAPEQTAFDGGMLSVKKGLFFRRSNSSEGSLDLKGTVDLRLSSIGGDLDFDGAVVTAYPRHPAIDGSNCSVSGLFSIKGQCQFTGRVDLYGACLNIFQIKKSTVTVGEKEQESALYAHCSRLTGSFTLGDDAILDGVDLTHSRVGGAFQFGSTDDEPYSEEQGAQGRQGPEVRRQLDLRHSFIGKIILVTEKWIEKKSSGMEVLVDGCEYGDILGHKCRNGANEDPDINYVGHWLLRISDAALDSKEPSFWSPFKKEKQYLVSVDNEKKYCPQIFSHLENVLIQKGRHREAREVGSIGALIRVEKKYGDDPCFLEKIQRCGLKFFSHLTSHSYSIKWVIFVSLLIIYGEAFFYKWAYHNDMIAFSSDIIGLEESRVLPLGGNSEVRDDEWGCFVFSVFGFHDYKTCSSCINMYSKGINKKYGSWPPYNYVEFNPFLYSMDVFLPIVDIGQERAWGLTTSGPWTTIWFLRVFQILTGWVFSGLVVAYFSGVMRKSY